MPPKSNKKDSKSKSKSAKSQKPASSKKTDKKSKTSAKLDKSKKSKKNEEFEESEEVSLSEELLTDDEDSTELSEDLDKSDSSDNMDYGADDDEEPEEEIIVIEDILDTREQDKSERLIKTGASRVMSDRLNHYELTSVICFRVAQIEAGSPIFTDSICDNPRDYAIAELKERKCTLKILRHSHANIYEEWKVNEMIIPLNNSSMMKK